MNYVCVDVSCSKAGISIMCVYVPAVKRVYQLCVVCMCPVVKRVYQLCVCVRCIAYDRSQLKIHGIDKILLQRRVRLSILRNH